MKYNGTPIISPARVLHEELIGLGLHPSPSLGRFLLRDEKALVGEAWSPCDYCADLTARMIAEYAP